MNTSNISGQSTASAAEKKGDIMHSKKRYWLGIGLLVIACLLMHLSAKSLENLRLLHHVLETFGYYTGHLDTPLTRWLWPVLAIVVIVLLVIARTIIVSVFDYDVKKRYKVIPSFILLVSLISCLTFPFIFGLFLRIPGGLNTVMLCNRNEVFYGSDDNREISFMLGFYKLSPGDEQFSVKLVDLNDSTNETTLDTKFTIDKRIKSHTRGIGLLNLWYYMGSSTLYHGVNVENMPGYDPELDNWQELRFKIVIFNEHESKTFYPYYRK